MNRKHVHIYKKRMKATTIIMLIIGILYGMYISRTTYQIEVPQLKKIKSIVLIQKKTIQELTDQDAIADIATLLKGKKFNKRVLIILLSMLVKRLDLSFIQNMVT